MKVIAVLALVSTSVFAQVENTGARADLQVLPVMRNQLGTGTPAPMITVGDQQAVYVDDGYYHIPQYLPNHPTAATIWPRVVEVECEKIDSKVICEGYHWAPAQGRAEYIMIIPKIKEKTRPIEFDPPAAGPKKPEVIVILKEVPVKKKGE